jgi:hypothetical protein
MRRNRLLQAPQLSSELLGCHSHVQDLELRARSLLADRMTGKFEQSCDWKVDSFNDLPNQGSLPIWRAPAMAWMWRLGSQSLWASSAA